MKRSVASAFALAPPTRIGYESDRVRAATNGTSMRTSCVSPDNFAICIERCIRKPAARFFRRLLKQQGQAPRRLMTDKLRSYAPAHRDVMPGTVHDTRQYANKRAELSHEPTRQRERQMRRFKSIGHAQLFLSVHGAIQNLLAIPRHLLRAKHYRTFRAGAFDLYTQVTCA
jgi:putative transposase